MRDSNDPFDLARFVHAQAGVYDRALAEVRAGRKQSHWMWFVFPQLAGLGSSAMAHQYAIQNEAEARAYLQHPVLGPRLKEISQAACDLDHGSALDVFGSPDDLKLRSSATLFACIAESESVFTKLLERYFDGAADPQTLQLLGKSE